MIIIIISSRTGATLRPGGTADKDTQIIPRGVEGTRLRLLQRIRIICEYNKKNNIRTRVCVCVFLTVICGPRNLYAMLVKSIPTEIRARVCIGPAEKYARSTLIFTPVVDPGWWGGGHFLSPKNWALDPPLFHADIFTSVRNTWNYDVNAADKPRVNNILGKVKLMCPWCLK